MREWKPKNMDKGMSYYYKKMVHYRLFMETLMLEEGAKTDSCRSFMQKDGDKYEKA